MALNPTNSWGVNAALTGEKRDAALKFIDFIARPKQTATFNKAIGALLSGLDLKNATIPDTYPVLKPLAPLLKRRNPVAPNLTWPNGLVQPAFNAALAGIFTGQKSIDQGLADMDNAYNQGAPTP
jgi:ABC-type glycerol-3-phosphate transport system substrate-binding protein